jgi:hypothetical protein
MDATLCCHGSASIWYLFSQLTELNEACNASGSNWLLNGQSSSSIQGVIEVLLPAFPGSTAATTTAFYPSYLEIG